jgi:hypothetical protein
VELQGELDMQRDRCVKVCGRQALKRRKADFFCHIIRIAKNERRKLSILVNNLRRCGASYH